MNRRDVAGVGALNVDYLYEVDDLTELRQHGPPLHPGRERSCSPADLTRLFQILERTGTLKMKSAGGSAANTIVALAGMGFSTGMVGRIGDDEDGRLIVENMGGIDLTRVKRGGRTGRCIVVLDRHRDRALLVQPNTNDTFTWNERDDYLSHYRYVHMSSFVADGALEEQKKLARNLPDHVDVTVDPGELYVKRGLAVIAPLLKRALILFVTDHEATLLTGIKDYHNACRDLLALGPRIVVCKRGEKGAYATTKDEKEEVGPRDRVEVVDNTGAGDVFNAGFLAGMLLNKSLKQSLDFAHMMAVRSLSAFGRAHYPTVHDLHLLGEECT